MTPIDTRLSPAMQRAMAEIDARSAVHKPIPTVPTQLVYSEWSGTWAIRDANPKPGSIDWYALHPKHEIEQAAE